MSAFMTPLFLVIYLVSVVAVSATTYAMVRKAGILTLGWALLFAFGTLTPVLNSLLAIAGAMAALQSVAGYVLWKKG